MSREFFTAIFFIPMILFLPPLVETIGFRPIYGVYCSFGLADFCSAGISGLFVYWQFKAWKR